jgi:cytochrome c
MTSLQVSFGPSVVVAALLLASAPSMAQSLERGKLLYEARCGACHSADTNRVGPAHQGVVGRKAGSVPGFAYSTALANSKLVWNRTSLLAWLTQPEAVIPGQAMNYSLGEAADRNDVVAYLATLSNHKPGASQ